MRLTFARSAATFSVAALFCVPFFSYEDVSHRSLTDRALVVAQLHSSDLPLDFRPKGKFGKEIIAGAGRHEGLGMLGLPTDGEDYTIYRIEGDCQVKVRRQGGRPGESPGSAAHPTSPCRVRFDGSEGNVIQSQQSIEGEVHRAGFLVVS
jgi:hypothetical protein